MQLAIDFGTTNTLAATLTQNTPTVLVQIPSLVYVQNGQSGSVISGQAVRDQGLDQQRDNRLFRNFKRGIVATPAPAPRLIDGTVWGDQEAGSHFVRYLIESLDIQDVEQLVLTAPVASFESYLNWLTGVMNGLISPQTELRIVDESTAAALGYAVTEPGAIVLVFDFGGGTLDLSLVQLPENGGGWLRQQSKAAKVIAKAGHILGGSDIDQWLLAAVLDRIGLSQADLGDDYSALLTICEQAKIALSSAESTLLEFSAANQAHELTLTRQDLEQVLERNGFFYALRRMIDKVMQIARQRGIFKEDVYHVLMVGGTSLMPSVQTLLQNYFTETAVRAHKPFTAVVEGALQVAAGFGLDDYLIHSYGLRHLRDNQHHYDEIIPAGTPYPTSKPFEITLGAAHDQQPEIEFIIGEIDTDAMAMVEVKYENGQAVFVARPDQNSHTIIPLNADSPTLISLKPLGVPGKDRLRAAFSIDAQRQLRVTVTDLKTKKSLLRDALIATLK